MKVAALLAMVGAVVAAVALTPTRADAQRAQPSLLSEAAVVTLHQLPSDTTTGRRTPILNRLSTEQRIGLAGILVAGTTIIVANNARAREPVRSGFAVDQRYFVAVGAIVGASVTAIWLERRKRGDRDGR